jgi:hypothetical protein
MIYGEGISREGDLLDLASERGLVHKSGAWMPLLHPLEWHRASWEWPWDMAITARSPSVARLYVRTERCASRGLTPNVLMCAKRRVGT